MTSSRRRLLPAVGIGLLAFGIRLAVVLHDAGGLAGMGNYDDGVYYATADALVHARAPYRDLLFLQPPGVTLALAPFAALGSLVGDAGGFALARLAFFAVGGVNAALVAVALRRRGVAAASAGALFWALSVPAIYSERSTVLEALGSLGVLSALALLSLTPSTRRAGRILPVAAGVALGLAVAVKIWYLLPVVLVAVCLGRRAVPFLVGAVVATAAVLTPFFLLDPVAMWREVVLDQLGRPRIAGSVVGRLSSILQPPSIAHVPRVDVLAVQIAIVLVLCALALRQRGGRLPVLLLVGCVALLLATPSYYRHYAALALPPLALLVGLGAGTLVDRFSRRRRAVGIVAVATVALACLATWPGSGLREFGAPGVPAGLTRATGRFTGGPGRACVASDDPTVLILTDTLSRDLATGCPVWPDTTGWLYDADARFTRGRPVPPARNAAWQAHATQYFLAADAIVLVRRNTGLDAASLQRLDAGRALFSGGRYTLRLIDR